MLLPPAVLGIGAGILLFSPVPVTIPEARPAPPAQPSFIYDIYDRQIALFKSFESKVEVAPVDIPLVLKQAVISAEDRSFYRHHGIDLRGTVRALVRDIESKSAQQGGSTITQQLVKIVYARNEQVRADEAARAAQAERSATGAEPATASDTVGPTVALPRRTLGRKLREAVIANRLDRTTPKEEILFEYLSNIYLGEGAYGVGAASLTYFRKPVRDLTLSEAATLAGVIPAPSAYEPRNNPARAELKRKAVLAAMLEEGYVTPIQYQNALAQRVWVETQGPPTGPVTLIFSPKQVETIYPYFVDYVRRYLLARYGEDKLYRGGLQVYTTIDPSLQAKAEETVSNALKGTKPPLEMALVAVEPLTGYVKALVGGRDFNAPNGQVNLALGNCPTLPELEKKLGRPPQLAPTCLKNTSVDGGGSGRRPARLSSRSCWRRRSDRGSRPVACTRVRRSCRRRAKARSPRPAGRCGTTRAQRTAL